MGFMTLPDEVEDALVEHLKARLTDVQDVAALTEGDFSEDDQIVTQTPAIRLFFRTAPFRRASDNTARIYEANQAWVVLCGAQDQRDFQTERRGALKLLGRVCNELAGARLKLESQEQNPQVVLTQASMFQVGPEGTWYALEISVEGPTQFEANG